MASFLEKAEMYLWNLLNRPGLSDLADILLVGLFWVVIYYISTAAQDPFLYFKY